MSPECIVPGAGSLTLAPHDAVARQAWAPRGGSEESEQDGVTARSGAVAAPAGQVSAPPGRPPTAPAKPQALNRYAYALNNPLKYIDPTGHCIGWIWGAPDCRFAGWMVFEKIIRQPAQAGFASRSPRL